jgi:GntR family transcriptional regulator, transcriptional repressor for pyruvate dehydrogenase complex
MRPRRQTADMLQVEIARRIERRIVDGTYPPGSKLPTEAALAQELGISRNVLREAVARLRSDGLVWSRQGRGMFVTDLPSAVMFRLDGVALSRRSELARLFELRLEVEAGAAALAAERRSTAQLRAIGEALSRLHAAMIAREDRVAADAAFHSAVARATGNHFFSDFVAILTFCISRNAAFGRARGPDAGDWAMSVFTEHEAVHERIAAGDAPGAAGAMRSHLAAATRRSGLARWMRSTGGAPSHEPKAMNA